MEVGSIVSAGGYDFQFNGVTPVVGANYRAARAEINVSKNGRFVEKLYPEKRNYTATGNVMTETAIDTGLFRDLYVSLGEPVSAGAWSVRIYYKPFVDWIWGGAILMAMGGGVALSDRRYALVARRQRETVKTKPEEGLPTFAAASVNVESGD
jgi:cytochrome c-type biogenesis protein CcmF